MSPLAAEGGDSYGETRTTLTVAAHSREIHVSLTGSWVGRCIFLAGNNLNESYGGSINPYFVLRT